MLVCSLHVNVTACLAMAMSAVQVVSILAMVGQKRRIIVTVTNAMPLVPLHHHLALVAKEVPSGKTSLSINGARMAIGIEAAEIGMEVMVTMVLSSISPQFQRDLITKTERLVHLSRS
jgi:hypothetical protein